MRQQPGERDRKTVRRPKVLPSQTVLRRKAEAKVVQMRGLKKKAPRLPARIAHELAVHQIELELQNEDLKSARESAEDGLKRYTELFDFAPIGYVVLTSDAVVREVNLVAATLLHRQRADLLGRRLSDLVSPVDSAAFNDLLLEARRRTTRVVRELSLGGRPNQRTIVRMSAVAIFGSGRILVAFEDITEQKEREARLEAVERELRAASRRKDEFLAMLGHEVRNALAPIRNSLFVLRRGAPSAELVQRARDIVDRQVAHMTRLIDDMLDVSRIKHGKIEVRKEPLDFALIVRQVLDGLRESFSRSEVRLESDLAPGVIVSGDAQRLAQIVMNLVGNALKFTPAAGTVRVTLREAGSSARLEIADTGVGIAPDVQRDLFEPFTQAKNANRVASGGLGLGLALVKGLAELHGGSAAISSEGPGRGTVATVTLPIAAEPPAFATPAEPTAASGAPLRVLIIEDNPDSAHSLQAALQVAGHRTEAAHDGATGLEVAHTLHPDVVICDLGLPGMDGYAVARALRADPSVNPTLLIALSGFARPEDKRAALDAGFDEHVPKPANPDLLKRALDHVVPRALGARPSRPGTRASAPPDPTTQGP